MERRGRTPEADGGTRSRSSSTGRLNVGIFRKIFSRSKSKDLGHRTESLVAPRTFDEVGLAQLVSIVDAFDTQAWSFTPDVADCREILLAHGGDTDRAASWLYDLKEAEEGWLEPISPPVRLAGAENAGNSCYFDALLFAMFATHTIFDGLLAIAIDPGKVAVRKFQASLRLCVNQLRRGLLVTRFTMTKVRDDAFAAGFAGANGLGTGLRTAQEDTSELFLWLLNTLEAPYLPLNETILHGAREEADDTKYSAERLLALDIPETSRDGIPLERLLEAFFFENRLEVTRSVERSAKVLDFNDETKGRRDNTTLLRVPALSALRILPFYTPQSQTGDQTEVSSAMWPDMPASPLDGSPPAYASSSRGSGQTPFLVLPILFKRYASTAEPPFSRRLSVSITIPASLRFTLFVNDLRDGDDGSDYVLELQSAVCHRGESVGSGHYVAVAKGRDVDGSNWLHFDDLAASGRVKKASSYADELALFDELSRDAYLTIWQLRKQPKSLVSEHDDHLFARALQEVEAEKTRVKAPASGWDPRNCAMQ